MRRFPALLVVAGLAAAPASAAAGPSDSPDSIVERFEWSTGRSRLGVMVSGLTPELRKHFGAPADRGLMVARVEPDSPAAKAGIAVGDVILEVGGSPIEEASDVIEALSTGSGSKSVVVVRDHERMTFDVTPKQTHGMPSNRWLRDFMRRMFPGMPTTTT